MGSLQQVTAVLHQQVKGVDDMGCIFGVGLMKAKASQGLKQICCGPQALLGTDVNVLLIGLAVDEKDGPVSKIAFESKIAIHYSSPRIAKVKEGDNIGVLRLTL
ncbi:hypothetical protein EMIT0324P_110089 [Pseudomonas chlororaphis]